MSELNSNTSVDIENIPKKKILESSWLNSFSIPILIVVFGALIVFAVTKMLSTERTYKDLVLELSSKSFGNRWVSAYELTKTINSNGIKEKDRGWVVDKLIATYDSTIDKRTKHFLIVALGALKSRKSIRIYADVLRNKKEKVDQTFQALVALSKLSSLEGFDVSLIKNYVKSNENMIKQTISLMVAKFKLLQFKSDLINYLEDSNLFVRYTAATSLLALGVKKSLNTTLEILNLKTISKGLQGEQQRLLLISNIFTALKKSNLMNNKLILASIHRIEQNDSNLLLKAEARKYLKQLKN